MEQEDTSEVPKWLQTGLQTGLQTAQEESAPEVDWLEAEARRNTFQMELQRLKRRAKKKPFMLVLVTSLLVLMVLFKISRKVHIYQATVIMRATESQIIDEESPFAGDGLENYLFRIALSRDRLLPIIEKFNLGAVDELRDSLDIDVNSNAFSRVRDDGDPLRSVGIAVHFFDRSPVRAFDVATALSGALIAAEQDRRADSANKLKTIADKTVAKVENRMSTINSELAEALLTIDKLKDKPNSAGEVASLTIAVRRMRSDTKQLDQRLVQMVGNQEEIALAAAAENADLGMRFEVIDVERPEYIPNKSLVVYAIFGIFFFVCLTPLVAIGLSAMDSKLHHIDDLIRLDLPVVGHMPGFPGDSKGSLKERIRRV